MFAFLTTAGCLLVALVQRTSAAAAPEPLSSSFGLPTTDTSNEWSSLTESVQFLPASDEGSPLLRHAQRRFLSYYSDHFVDGQETAYNEYAQAWRLLGLYIDCNAADNAEEQRRRLEDGGGDDNGDDQGEDANDDQGEDANDDQGEDANDDQGENANDDQGDEEVEEEENDGSVCARQLLWAAYVDLDYEGNGLSEYKIYNAEQKKWDNSACNDSNSNRCVKMDCHQPGTNFKPLGYFLEDSPADFLYLLAQHQGSCTWSEERSNAVDDSVEWLPQQCTETEVVVHDSDGSATYVKFDLKPTSGGGVDIGLYTDYKCSQEYAGTEVTRDGVLASYIGYDVEAEETLQYLNEALDSFKVCTPCRTFDLSYDASQNAADGENDDGDENQDDGNDNNDPNNANYVCVDSAGYEGTNQCMMFAQNSQKASFRDISIASQQRTITRTYATVDVNESWWQAWGFFLMSLLVFLLGLVCFCSIAVKRKRVSSSGKNEPLIRQ